MMMALLVGVALGSAGAGAACPNYLPDFCGHQVNFHRSSDDENDENHCWMEKTMLDPLLTDWALYEPPYVIHLLRLPLSNATDLCNSFVGCRTKRERKIIQLSFNWT